MHYYFNIVNMLCVIILLLYACNIHYYLNDVCMQYLLLFKYCEHAICILMMYA